MRNKLLFISLIVALLSQLTGHAQEEVKLGKMEGKYYVVRDTIDGKPWAHYYNSEKAYLQQTKKRKNAIDDLKEKKRLYESDQRTQLAETIKRINERVEKVEGFTKEMAQKDKIFQAEQVAEKIKKHNELVDAEIEFYKVKSTYRSTENSPVSIDVGNDGGFELTLGRNGKESMKSVRTNSFLSLGFGYNFMDGENLDINDFSYANNNYFSVAFIWQTALNKKQTIRFNTGIQYQTHGTELNGDRVFSTNQDNTEIVSLGFQPDKAKFRQDQFVVPLQLEFGGTRKKEYEDGRVRYEQWDKWKFGIGGFAGFNTSSRLKLKYEDNNREVKETIINAFDNNVFVYGIDAYVGFDNYNLFARMNLNDVFKDGSVDAQYIAFGIRLQ